MNKNTGQEKPMKSGKIGEKPFAEFNILNPKRKQATSKNPHDDSLFPYYAGFSLEFADSLLKSANITSTSLVLDPWNGSGTTTYASTINNINSIGIDLNPSMVIAAKARILSPREFSSLIPLGHNIIAHFSKSDLIKIEGDPLLSWFSIKTASYIRTLEHVINQILVSSNSYKPLSSHENLENISDIASFYYVSLFQTVRFLIKSFTSTNPTWIKKAKHDNDRININKITLVKHFNDRITHLSNILNTNKFNIDNNCFARMINANSTKLPIDSDSIDLILTSPPYCTRIDYAVATSPELATIGFSDSNFDTLRRQLLGTTTVPQVGNPAMLEWGETCLGFLDAVASHPSKASKTYYHKNLCYYFDNLYRSLYESQRVLKHGHDCILVVQDSYYKDIFNNLPQIVLEMAYSLGFSQKYSKSFTCNKSMVDRNSRSRKYLDTRTTSESVIILTKTTTR